MQSRNTTESPFKEDSGPKKSQKEQHFLSQFQKYNGDYKVKQEEVDLMLYKMKKGLGNMLV